MSRSRRYLFLLGVLLLGISQLPPVSAQGNGAVKVFLEPSSLNNLSVGNVFQVSLLVDTSGHSINAIDINLKFDQDKLQVVDPSLGQSVVGVWASPPSFSNQSGILKFSGGILPPGINTNRGLISTIAFRARSPGDATIRFSGDNKILPADGSGTNLLSSTVGGHYFIKPSPAEGPEVSSFTHPDPTKWYTTAEALALEWSTNFVAEGYSYSISEVYDEVPDNISEGLETSVNYTNLEDGLYYFHIKALRGGVWGGVTHFPVRIDRTPPADFDIKIRPSSITSNRLPIVDFRTTDVVSGLNRYEIQVVSLDKGVVTATMDEDTDTQSFFLETPERYVPQYELEPGKYDIIVRAYDNAGNFREIKQRLNIISPGINVYREGLSVYGFYISWSVLLLILLLILLLVGYLAIRARRSHHRVSARISEGALKDPIIKKRLEELSKMKEGFKNVRHGGALALLLAVGILSGLSQTALAQEAVGPRPIDSPIITNIADEINTEDSFYVSGVTGVKGADILIHIQDKITGEVITETITSDEKGDWLYLRSEPFEAGEYLLWTQTQLGSAISAPSSHVEFEVERSYIGAGASRISYGTWYMSLSIVLLLGLLTSLGFYFYHLYHGRKKDRKLSEEIREAEGAIKQGFVTLHEDIHDELKLIHKAKLSKSLTEEIKEKEKNLLKHLEEVEKFIKKEFRDVKLASEQKGEDK